MENSYFDLSFFQLVRKYIIKEKTRHLKKKNMKQLFLFLLMMNLSFAGRELFLFDAPQKLHEIKCRLIQIRTHLGYMLTINDFLPLTDHERNEYYQKFDELWAEFVTLKPFFQEQFTTYNQKMTLVLTTILLRKDRDRYARERRTNAALARLFTRLSLGQNNEELTQ